MALWAACLQPLTGSEYSPAKDLDAVSEHAVLEGPVQGTPRQLSIIDSLAGKKVGLYKARQFGGCRKPSRIIDPVVNNFPFCIQVRCTPNNGAMRVPCRGLRFPFKYRLFGKVFVSCSLPNADETENNCHRKNDGHK